MKFRNLIFLFTVLFSLVFGIDSVRAINFASLQLTHNNIDDENPQISGDIIVWEGETSGNNTDIFSYDMNTTQMLLLTTNSKHDFNVRIDGNNVVWTRSPSKVGGSDDSEILMYDISTMSTTNITDDDAADVKPSIDGDYLVWQGAFDDDPDNGCAWHILDLATPTLTQLDEDSCTWQNEALLDVPYFLFFTDDQPWLFYDIDNEETNTAFTDSGLLPHVDDGRAVYNSGEDIFLLDFATETSTQLTDTTETEYDAVVSGDFVAFTVVTEPSTNSMKLFTLEISTEELTLVDDAYSIYNIAIENDLLVWTSENSLGKESMHRYSISTGVTSLVPTFRATYVDQIVVKDGEIVWVGPDKLTGDKEVFWVVAVPCCDPPLEDPGDGCPSNDTGNPLPYISFLGCPSEEAQ